MRSPSAKVRPWIAVTPLVFFFLMGKLLQVTNGEYRWFSVPIFTTIWAVSVVLLWKNPLSLKDLSSGLVARVASVGVIYSAIELALRPSVNFNQKAGLLEGIRILLFLGVVASLALAILVFRDTRRSRIQAPSKAFWWLCSAAGVAWFASKVLTVAGSPHPNIDCYTISAQAAHYFLSGINPYSQNYPDIYGGHYGYTPTMTYWPGVLYPQVLAQRMFGDIRYAFVLADLVCIFALVRIAKHLKVQKHLQALVPLMWLSFPVTLHVLEMSWTDTLLVSASACVLLAVIRERWLWAGVALGYFCATKQYCVFFAALTLPMVWLRGGHKALIQCMAASVAVVIVALLPFMIADFHGFYASTLQLLIDVQLRRDAMSIPAAAMNLFNYTISAPIMAGSYLLATLLGVYWIIRRNANLQSWSGGLVLVYGAVFLMGKQAFCNYYYMLTFFMLLTLLCFWEQGIHADSRNWHLVSSKKRAVTTRKNKHLTVL